MNPLNNPAKVDLDSRADRLLALVGALDEGAGAAETQLWEFRGKSLLARAIEVAQAVSEIVRIVVVSEGPQAAQVAAETQVEFVQRCPPIEDSPDPLSLRRLLGRVKRHLKSQGKWPPCAGVVYLDPRCPLRTAAHVREAVRLYQGHAQGDRPWPGVVSVEGVTNHYHPKKVLFLNQAGALEYYDPEGRHVQRRQQLDDDPRFCRNGAVEVFDPLEQEEILSSKANRLAYVIETPLIWIERPSDLRLAEALRHGESVRLESR